MGFSIVTSEGVLTEKVTSVILGSASASDTCFAANRNEPINFSDPSENVPVFFPIASISLIVVRAVTCSLKSGPSVVTDTSLLVQ